jgi:hypothetical protein
MRAFELLQTVARDVAWVYGWVRYFLALARAISVTQ